LISRGFHFNTIRTGVLSRVLGVLSGRQEVRMTVVVGILRDRKAMAR